MHCKCYLMPAELSQSPSKEELENIIWTLEKEEKKNQTQVLDKRNKCSSGAMLSFHFQYLNFFILSKYSGFWIYYGVLYVEVTCKLLLYRHSILT